MPAVPPQTQIEIKHTNRLAKETSPYLLQHAHNPVDWYPWGDEAFKAARDQDKPIFLSIGYSTCYWCHVMERESFESEEVAAIMNEHFICIKVDREERPDVDDIYMTATQMLTGSGGWPMSVFLEPKTLKPFVAGTYFPPRDAYGRPGFPTVLKHVADAWKNKRPLVTAQSEQIAGAVKEHLAEASQPVPVGENEVEKAIGDLLTVYDPKDGGFVGVTQRAPKFPTPVNLDFLLRAGWDHKHAREAVIHTLNRMAMGGMYDQIGGGFHRYSVDEKWLVPHFEKMLYDNGQLVSTYARAFELTKDEYYAEVIRETLEYVLREMTSPEGAFFSAQDAEVDGAEGANYLWNADEITQALESRGFKEFVPLALDVYGVSAGTNFQDPHHPELPAKNVLFLAERPDRLAAKHKIAPKDFYARLEIINAALLGVRQERKQPRLDDKIIAGWNGLMIAAFADAGRVLNDKKYTGAAQKAADFMLQRMRTREGGLMRTASGGNDAFLEDYALVIKGLLAVHRATNDQRMLEEAKRFAQAARQRFWDEQAGGYFDTLANQSDLFVRVKSMHDGAIPAGNSVMLHNLLDLHQATGQSSHLSDAAATLKAMSSTIAKHPTSAALATAALHRFVKDFPDRLDAAPNAVANAEKPTGYSPFGNTAPPVKASITPNEVQVKPGSPASFEVVLAIRKPYHVNSNKPGDQFLIPLTIALTGCDGLKITPEYPKGETYKTQFSTDTTYVHHDTVRIPVKLEQTGKFSGTPRITVTYQTCTDKECLEPKTETLGIRIIAQR